MKHYINNGKAYSYTYDEAGNISRIQNPDGSWVTYTYDALNQLIQEEYSLPLEGKVAPQATDEVSYNTIQYTYDTRGNILSKTYSLDGTTVATVNYGYTDSTWKDRLTSYNGVTITSDTIGNPLSWHDGSAMTWQRGRQLATLTKNGTTISFAYNDDGIRTAKTVNGTTTNYSVVDGTLRRMSDGTNTLEFVYANGLSSVIFNGTEYWYVFNAQGDVVGLINANGEYVVEYLYDSWGKILSKTGTLADTLGTLNPFRYRGYIYDEETGFYYVSSRYYDPAVGRWLNCDSEIAGVSGDIRGYNQFAYCFNNPVNMSDSTGNWPEWVKNAVKWVAQKVVYPVIKTVEEYLSDKTGTKTVGIGGSASFGILEYSVQLGVSVDTKGNIALQATLSGGFTTNASPTASAAIYSTNTNAPSVNSLEGMGYQMGAAVNLPLPSSPVSAIAGMDVNFIPKSDNPDSCYLGRTIYAGIAPATSYSLVDAHVLMGYTWTLGQLNLFDLARDAYDAIMKW